jgi:MarR family transcriptional regulator for hemolysin
VASDDPRTDWLGFALQQAAGALRAETEARLAEHDLDARTFGGLLFIAARVPTQVELGRALAMDRTSIMQLVDRLAAAGWVEREPVPGDRRANRVRLRADAISRLKAAERAAREAERDWVRARGVDRGLLLRELSVDSGGS